jgi:hypothetical protein
MQGFPYANAPALANNYQNFQQNMNPVHNNVFTNTDGRFTDRDKAALDSLLHMDKELIDLYNSIRLVKPKDYPMFPKGDKYGNITSGEYLAWRRVFLLNYNVMVI